MQDTERKGMGFAQIPILAATVVVISVSEGDCNDPGSSYYLRDSSDWVLIVEDAAAHIASEELDDSGCNPPF